MVGMIKRPVKLSEAEIPETWDTIKYTKPIYPTCSRQRFGTYSYSNNKYHCYRVVHSAPTYNLMPYRPTGFGFAERNSKYIPLTHVQDRSGGKRENILSEKSKMMKVYEKTLDEIKQKQEFRRNFDMKQQREAGEIRTMDGNYRNLVRKLKYETKNLINDTDEMIGECRYRTHQINRTVRDYNDLLSRK